MPISFNEIPDVKEPGIFAEIDNSGALSGLAGKESVMLVSAPDLNPQGSERMMRASKSTGVCSDNSTERRCLKCWSAFRGRKTTLFSSFPPAWHECSQKVGG